MLLLPAGATLAQSCGDIDPTTQEVIQCGNGPVDLYHSWGLLGSETPKVLAGTTVRDQTGMTFDCPLWVNHGCFDLTGTDWYRNQMIDLAREILSTGQQAYYPQFNGWFIFAR